MRRKAKAAVTALAASNCATGAATEGAGTSQFCTSLTGAIVKVSPHGQATSVLTELPSVTEEAIGEVTGPSAIGYGHGQEAVTIDDFLVNKDGGNSLLPRPFASAFGTLRLISHGKGKAVGNPAPITGDAQAVPTSVAIGPDGALYASLLRGAPSDPGTADIYRVVPGHQPEIWSRGLTSVTAIAFDRQGRLLATEFNTGGLLSPPTVPGALVRISADGQTVTALPVPGLYQPTGVAVSADGTVYVSNDGDSTAASSQPGEIVKITGLS